MAIKQGLSHLFRLGLAVQLMTILVPQIHAQQTLELPSLSVDQIVARLVQKNEERAKALERYTSHRRYRLEYRGFPGSRDATMEVDASFDAPTSKRFTIISESGSKLILNRVFRRLLESEQEAADASNQARVALTSSNYAFSSAGIAGSNYVLNVEPRQESKFLFRGRIWVDGHDFAVTRIEAEPAKNPSFWTRKSEIQHTYEKVDNYFYLPKQNRTVTNTKLGGIATLTIEYLSYLVVVSSKMPTAIEAEFGSEPVADRPRADPITLAGNLK